MYQRLYRWHWTTLSNCIGELNNFHVSQTDLKAPDSTMVYPDCPEPLASQKEKHHLLRNGLVASRNIFSYIFPIFRFLGLRKPYMKILSCAKAPSPSLPTFMIYDCLQISKSMMYLWLVLTVYCPHIFIAPFQSKINVYFFTKWEYIQ